MKKFIFASVAVIAVLAITLCLNAQPAGGGMGGEGGFGGGAGGGMGGGMMGGGGRGTRGPVVRPDKATRLASIKTLETQIAALKAAIDKAPDKDPNLANADEAAIQKATTDRQPETDAITAIQTTLASLRGATAGGRGMGGGGASADVLSELRVLANGEKATKTVARIDALIKEAQTTGARRGGRGQGGMGGAGGGMMGGGAGGGMMGGGAGGGAGAGGRRGGA